ncbi:hypothetical protein D3C75_822830 [compost metagenome]
MTCSQNFLGLASGVDKPHGACGNAGILADVCSIRDLIAGEETDIRRHHSTGAGIDQVHTQGLHLPGKIKNVLLRIAARSIFFSGDAHEQRPRIFLLHSLDHLAEEGKPVFF